MLGASTFGAKSTSTKETAPPWHSAAAAAVASKNAGVWGSTLPVTPVGGRSPAGSFSSNRRLSNASTNSARSVANAARMSNRVAGGASSLHGTLSNGRLSKEATATAIQLVHNQSSAESRRKLKKARAVMSAYENHTRAANAANEAHFRRLNELYGPRGGQGATASATGSANAAASWAVPPQVSEAAAVAEAFPQQPLTLPSAFPSIASGGGARIFGAAKPLPAAAAAVPSGSGAQGPLLNAFRRNSRRSRSRRRSSRRRSSRSRRSRSQRQQTRRSH